jgi:hypothetical protein
MTQGEKPAIRLARVELSKTTWEPIEMEEPG